LKELFQALQGTSRSSNESLEALMDFEDRYEIFVAAKVLEGSVEIVMHLLGTIDAYVQKARAQTQTVSDSKGKRMIELNITRATILRNEMARQQRRAVIFASMLGQDKRTTDAGFNTQTLSGKLDNLISKQLVTQSDIFGLDPRDTVHKLWGDMGRTYDEIQALIGDERLLGDLVGKVTALKPVNA
jgi:hypothetical protein